MKRRPDSQPIVGLDIGSSSVKAVELSGKPGSLSLAGLGFAPLQPDTVVDGQIMELNDVSGVIAEVFRAQQIKTDRVAAGVSGSSVIVKNIIVPQMTREELEESIDWHAEEHIPFDIADVSLDYQVVGSGPDSLHVLMAACKRDFVASLKQVIQLAGKQPAVIDVDAFALQNCYEVNYQPPDDLVVALLNVGASTMNINILRGARSVFTRDVSVGGNQYTSLLQKELGVTYEQAELMKRGGAAAPGGGGEAADVGGVLETVSDVLALEISKTFDFYRATADESEAAVRRILISGGGSKLPGLPEFLAERFEIEVERLDPFRRIGVDARRFDPEYMREVVPEMAVAVGLALRGFDPLGVSIDLLNAAVGAIDQREERRSVRARGMEPHAPPVERVHEFSRIPARQMSAFWRQFSRLIDSGLPLVETLAILSQQQRNKYFAQVLTQVRLEVESGTTLASAMGQHEKVFDPISVSVVEAGEMGGILDLALQRLLIYYEKTAKLRRDIISALIYPSAFIIILALWAVRLLGVPVLQNIASRFTEQPPRPAVVWGLTLGVILVGVIGVFYYYKTPRGRRRINTLLFMLPVFRDLPRNVSIARFSLTLSTLLSSGVSIIRSLDITARTSGNVIFEEATGKIRFGLTHGESFFDAMRATGVFPDMALQMARIGEQIGNLDYMLGRIADFYEQEIDARLLHLSLVGRAVIFFALIAISIAILSFQPFG